MASIAASGIVLEPLTKGNYDNWSCLVRNYLVGHGLWEVVSTPVFSKMRVGSSKEEFEACNRDNAKALHIIQLACGSEKLADIRDFHYAKDAWDLFSALYGSESYTKESIVQSNTEQVVEDDGYRPLYRFIESGNWNDAKRFMESNKISMFSTSSSGRSILHVAAIAGQKEIVKKLVKEGKDKLVKMKDKHGYTALALVAELTENTDIAKCMVENKEGKVFGEDLLYMKTNDGETPLLLAASKGNKEMTSYLYSNTNRWDEMRDNNFHTCSMLFTLCINAEIFDVALGLLQRFEKMPLAVISKSRYKCGQPLYALARMPHAFLRSSRYGLIQGFLYKVLTLPEELKNIHGHQKTRTEKKKLLKTNFAGGRPGQLLQHIHILFQNLVLLKLSGIRKIYNQKKAHTLVREILNCMDERINHFKESELRKAPAHDAMLEAAKHGNIEFIDAMREANPDLLLAIDDNERGIFALAILNRRIDVFRLIDDRTVIGNRRMEIGGSRTDVSGNSLLHLAARLSSSSIEGRYSPALQMQNELIWFKLVESKVHPKYKEAKNREDKTPRQIFTESHHELMKEGERWAKDTAESFTLVATLIITIMFAAAFTVPGGNDQDSGVPLFLQDKIFKVFIIADAISLITSSTSVLLFIGILTSRYADKDFLKSLPLKLFFAIFALFLSVVSMMVAFCASLAMVLKGNQGIIIATISLASIPVIVFVPTQLRLFFEIFQSMISGVLSS